jgi:hypothetical protein
VSNPSWQAFPSRAVEPMKTLKRIEQLFASYMLRIIEKSLWSERAQFGHSHRKNRVYHSFSERAPDDHSGVQ